MANESNRGTWRGLQWRFVGLAVVAIAVLQVIAYYGLKYEIYVSLPLAILIVSYLVIPRVKEHRLLNAWAAVIASWVIGVFLEFILPQGQILSQLGAHPWVRFVELYVLFPLVLGLVVSYLYLRLTMWSERKRDESNAKRQTKEAATRGKVEERPLVRHHSDRVAKEKQKRKNRRRQNRP